MANTISARECEKALQLGMMYSPERAFSIGLVDQLVGSSENLIEQAERQMNAWLKVPSKSS